MGRNAGISTQLDCNEGVCLISAYTGFISFCNSPSAYPSTYCDIKQSVSFSRNQDATQFCFEITANCFLVHGVISWNIVAWIHLIGSSNQTVGDFERALLKHDEVGGGQVVYPFMDVQPDFDPKSVMLVAQGDP